MRKHGKYCFNRSYMRMQTHLKRAIRGLEPSVLGIYYPFLFFDAKQSRYAEI